MRCLTTRAALIWAVLACGCVAPPDAAPGAGVAPPNGAPRAPGRAGSGPIAAAPLSLVHKPAPPPTTAIERPAPPPPPAPPPHDGLSRYRQAADAADLEFRNRYPRFGVAFHFLAHVLSEPSASAQPMGYLRRGARVRATPGQAGPGCERHWYALSGGGYVCAGRGFALGETPRSFEPAPAPPRLRQPLPYVYRKTLGGPRAQYFRIPTPAEEAETEVRLAEWEALAQAGQVPEAQPAVPAEPLAAQTQSSPARAQAAEPDLQPAPDAGVGSVLPDYVRLPMQPGFYVSVDAIERRDDGAEFLRTVRGAYVRADATIATSAPQLHGVALPNGAADLPLGLTFRTQTTSFREGAPHQPLQPEADLPQLTAIPLSAERARHAGQAYHVARDGRLLRTGSLRVVQWRGRPPLVRDDDRWLHVRLSTQTLVAYEGDQPVYATLVSTGKPGFETPSGLFRIHSKHVSTTMAGTPDGDDAYRIEDVPWTLYFQGSYALHAAFWHTRFGRPRSHGCVNLAPADARFIFNWSDPELPSGWHGALATRNRPGTLVFIED